MTFATRFENGIDKDSRGFILISFGASDAINTFRVAVEMKIRPVIQLVLVLLLPASCWASSQVDSLESRIKLEAWVDRPELAFDQKLLLTAQASWDGEQARFKITPIAPPQCESFEILGSSSVNETKMVEGKAKSTKTFEFMLKPTQTGTGRIGAVVFSYVDNVSGDSSTLSTQPISVTISPPIERETRRYKIVLIIAIALIFIYVLYSAKRKSKRVTIADQTRNETKIAERSLEEKNLEMLSVLSHLIPEGKVDEFSSKVYKLISNYLEDKYHILTTGKTTNDIIDSLSTLNLPEERIIALKDILSTCDRVKFAREMAEQERCERVFNQAKKFLEQNMM